MSKRLSFISVSVIVVLLIVIYIVDAVQPFPRNFDPHTWRSSYRARIAMSRDLIKSRRLIGMKKAEITSLLGTDADQTSDNWMCYPMGSVPGQSETWRLDLHLSDGKVDEYEIHCR
jgi:hypothetical protein